MKTETIERDYNTAVADACVALTQVQKMMTAHVKHSEGKRNYGHIGEMRYIAQKLEELAETFAETR